MHQTKLEFVRKSSYLRIVEDRVVVLKLAILDPSGEVLEYRENFSYLHGRGSGAPAKVESFLDHKQVGDRGEVALAAEDAFGRVDPGLVMTVPASALPENARRPGDRLQGEAPDGSLVEFVVERSEGDSVTVNGNHPYAGKALTFVMEVTDVREARSDELTAGFAFETRAATGGP